jgi:pimeloyl-ACP methyl ester carboxylesterase
MPHIKIRGQDLHYLDRGSGFPVLFGESYLWDAAMWAPQVERLSNRYRCILPELWGHGKSGAIPEVPYSMSKLTEDMRTLVDALGLEQFAIVGLSVGGIWGLELALDCPERVSSLVLMDTAAGPEPAVTQAQYFGMLDLMEQMGAVPPPLADQVAPIYFAPDTRTRKPTLIEGFRQSLLGIGKDRIASVVALGRAIFSRRSLLDRLGEIRCPTLVAVGRHDRPRPLPEAEALASSIAGARLEIIEGAGHISNLEQPERVLAMLEDFLSSSIEGRVAHA